MADEKPEPANDGVSRDEKRRLTAEANFLEHVAGPAIAELKDAATVVEVAPELSPKDWRGLLRIGGAVVAGRPLVVVVPEGHKISTKLMQAADYLVGGDLTTIEGKAAAEAANLKLLAGIKVTRP